VPLNVPLVKDLLITVLFVPKTELTLHLVSVLTDNTSMVPSVLIVLTNVVPVPPTKPVSLVPMLPETMDKFVIVKITTMKTKPPNVHLVQLNVISV
jgi:hypothetical protein